MRPSLSILIAALNGRPWKRLVDTLEDQAEQYGTDVEILVAADNGEKPSGAKRQHLMDVAKGYYIAFVDDDDLLADDYISSLMTEIEWMPDVVTFDLKQVSPWGEKFWSYCTGLDDPDDDRLFRRMSANHLCAWRANVARMVSWCPHLGNGDDQLWYKPLKLAFPEPTERHINKVLYTYVYNPRTTRNQTDRAIEDAKAYWGDGLQCFLPRKTEPGAPKEVLIQHGHGTVRILRTNTNEYVEFDENKHQFIGKVTRA